MSNRSQAIACLLKDTHPELKPDTSIRSSDVLSVVVNHFENLNANNVETYSIHLLSLQSKWPGEAGSNFFCHQCENDFGKGMDLKRHNTLKPDTSMQS